MENEHLVEFFFVLTRWTAIAGCILICVFPFTSYAYNVTNAHEHADIDAIIIYCSSTLFGSALQNCSAVLYGGSPPCRGEKQKQIFFADQINDFVNDETGCELFI